MLNLVFDGNQFFLDDGTPLLDAIINGMMGINFADLMKIRMEIDRVMVDVRHVQIAKLKENVLQEMALLGITPEQLFAEEKPEPVVENKPSVAKYRDPETGKTWSGKGKRPKWFDAARADAFLIESGVPAESAESPF